MTPVTVDSNVLLDVVTDDPTWGEWSSESLEQATDEAVLVINAFVYAEVSIGFAPIEALDEALPSDLYRRERMPYEPHSSPGRRSCAIGRPAASGTRRSPTSTSVLMPRLLAIDS